MENLQRELERTERFEVKSFFSNLFDKFLFPKRHKLRKKFQIQLDKELDLEKTIRRFRLLVISALGTMTADQNVFSDMMSQYFMRESSDFENTSSDQELDANIER
jgi:hypothetical protein